MKTPDFSEWVQRFFQEYLSRQRNVSPATVAAYRDTFRLLLQVPGASSVGRTSPRCPWRS